MFASGEMYNTQMVEFLGHITEGILVKCQHRYFQQQLLVLFRGYREPLLEIEPNEVYDTDTSLDTDISRSLQFVLLS